MTCVTNWMQQLWFINNQLAQHVSGIIMSIFNNAKIFITAHILKHCKPYVPIMCFHCDRMTFMFGDGWQLVLMCCTVCFVCGYSWCVFLLWQVKVLLWEGAWCGGVVLDSCVLWLEVASYVWSEVCAEWL